jgi:hypothetical protein
MRTKILKDKIVNLNFKNINKMFPKDVIRKMRQEDLRTFLVKNKKFMSKQEEDIYFKRIIGTGSDVFPAGNEFLVERKGGRLKFINFD